MVGTGTAPTTLPSHKSRDAPDKFKGHYSKVREFLRQYERLLTQCQITLDKKKCEGITNYCTSQVGRLIESLDEYEDEDWEGLKATILHLYDAEREDACYRKSDLRKLTQKYAKKSLDKMSQWKAYVRKFTVVAQWLKAAKVIQDEEYCTYFWKGIPKHMREMVQVHLLAGKTSSVDMSKPFEIKDVSRVVN